MISSVLWTGHPIGPPFSDCACHFGTIPGRTNIKKLGREYIVGILENIGGHEDLLRLTDEERDLLCGEIRDFLVSSVSKTGGHLASNLGTVELSVALETVFDTMKDRLVFDVGHQAYVHKLLTGRQADFEHLRQFGGMSGFPKPHESDADSFVAGHASSSVSIALGMARARTLLEEDYQVVALIGDGAATGGMAYEGLNDLAESREPMVVILNDNEMSIDRNVGGMAHHLTRLRSKDEYLRMKKNYRKALNQVRVGRKVLDLTRSMKNRVKRFLVPSTIFENMGMTYLGPVDGHDLPRLISLLRTARDLKEPVLVHVLTHKGLGYGPAEENPAKFHGIGKFDPATGKTLSAKVPSFSDSFGETMVELAGEDKRVCAITAAMPGGTGLLQYRDRFPKRLFDVGIAEEHAVSMAGGLAKQGMIPVVALYSTFLQRSYDQIMQDVAMLKLHVVLAVDRAGLVGEDGETHHGVFDVGFLSQVPGMTILCPVSLAEQKDMLRWAVKDFNGPVAVRYPRGGDCGYSGSDWGSGSVKCHREGKDVTLISYGTMAGHIIEAAQLLAAEGIEATVLRLMKVAPLPVDEIRALLPDSRPVIVAEEACTGSGIGQMLAQRLKDKDITVMDLGDKFVTHGAMNTLYKHYGLDARSIADKAREAVRG
ncbi:MAG: 1-deoxy-D-xylulose-5-phosphate synthase [Oscillospiraceae bacterium]|nr:1-deoxy-D-xylulose-5-phosphate synthase [Oscillospiraceae bacterium]